MDEKDDWQENQRNPCQLFHLMILCVCVYEYMLYACVFIILSVALYMCVYSVCRCVYYIYIYIYIYIYMCVCIYIYIYICVWTDIFTYMCVKYVYSFFWNYKYQHIYAASNWQNLDKFFLKEMQKSIYVNNWMFLCYSDQIFLTYILVWINNYLHFSIFLYCFNIILNVWIIIDSLSGIYVWMSGCMIYNVCMFVLYFWYGLL